MPIAGNINRGRALLWTPELEEQARDQVESMTRLGILDGHLAVMPDAHHGIGSTVGTVIPTREAIIPASVGVDIGCGMVAAQTTLAASDLPDSLSKTRKAIERKVPVGRGRHRDADLMARNHAKANRLRSSVEGDERMEAVLPAHWRSQAGTLGGGNHFIELCIDENENVWIMLHSGSRGAGNCIGRHWIAIAKREMQRFNVHLPNQDLAYLREGSTAFEDYFFAMSWAQDFAAYNRELLLELTVDAVSQTLPPFRLLDDAVINCHHNYVETADADNCPVNYAKRRPGTTRFLTRKGAISARTGEMGIIPGSMGAKSFIVRGKGNARSHYSSSHGAGRRMSRTDAKRKYRVQDLVAQTEGVECRKDESVLDEIPSAYKDIDEVMASQHDLTDIVHTLRAVLCVKG